MHGLRAVALSVRRSVSLPAVLVTASVWCSRRHRCLLSLFLPSSLCFLDLGFALLLAAVSPVLCVPCSPWVWWWWWRWLVAGWWRVPSPAQWESPGACFRILPCPLWAPGARLCWLGMAALTVAGCGGEAQNGQHSGPEFCSFLFLGFSLLFLSWGYPVAHPHGAG